MSISDGSGALQIELSSDLLFCPLGKDHVSGQGRSWLFLHRSQTV